MSNIEIVEESTIFNSEENRILNKTIGLREKIIDQMSGVDLPTKAHELLALNTILDAMDKQVMDKVKIRAKQEEESGKNKTIAMVAEILGKIDTKNGHVPLSNNDIILSDNFLPNDIVPGETEVSPDKLSLADFVKGEEYEFSN
jgi:hypothetical protein